MFDRNVRLTTKLERRRVSWGSTPYFDGVNEDPSLETVLPSWSRPFVSLLPWLNTLSSNFGTGWLQAYGIGDNLDYRNSSVSSVEFVAGVKVGTP